MFCLQAGDALYLPQMWWHYVHSPKMRQQAVAMWWKSIPLMNSSMKKSGETRSSARVFYLVCVLCSVAKS